MGLAMNEKPRGDGLKEGRSSCWTSDSGEIETVQTTVQTWPKGRGRGRVLWLLMEMKCAWIVEIHIKF